MAPASSPRDIRHGGASSTDYGTSSGRTLGSYSYSRCSLPVIGFTLGVSLSPCAAFGVVIPYLCRLEFNDYNGALFTIRARALNNLIYWLSQIVGSVSIGFLLDQRGLSRRLRAFSGWVVLMIMVFVVHVWAYIYQKCVLGDLMLTSEFD